MRTQKRTPGYNSTTINSIASLELHKANNAIEQFLYSCSHTLRSPLKSISGLVNLLKLTKDNPDVTPEVFLYSIEQTVSKMELVLNELETFLVNSRQLIQTHPVDLQALVKSVLTEKEEILNRENIQVSIRIDQTVPLFNDARRISAILTQLVSNAIQFRDAKPISKVGIHIQVNPSTCILEVVDNGIGIKPNVLPHIYEVFYRGSELSTGAGVGLYIVREIVNKLNGTITTSSTEGEGSTFQVELPNLQ